MTVIMFFLIFSGGVILGLILFPLAGLIDSGGINPFLKALVGMVATPFSLCTRFIRTTTGFLQTPQSVRKIDAREQQISDSAQIVRGILLILASAIQRTVKVASDSSQVLGDVRNIVEQMDLPTDLSDIHSTLVREIDLVVSSNSNLKGELDRSREILASQQVQIEALRSAVRIDGLTQLANRAYFDEKLSEKFQGY